MSCPESFQETAVDAIRQKLAEREIDALLLKMG